MQTERIEIPDLEYFQSKNIFTGSDKGFNFKINPKKIKSDDAPDFWELRIRIWYGKLCCEKSEITAEKTFVLLNENQDEEFDCALNWIEKQRKIYHENIKQDT